jgi:signal transduction histidine kinase
MVKKAVAYLKEKGNQDAFAEFSNPKGKFVDRDLYIYVLDMDRNSLMMAHGANKGLIGKEFQQLKDSDGKLFIQEINKKARAAGGGWVDYKWTNPVSKKVEPKTAYFEKYNNLVVICGAYK